MIFSLLPFSGGAAGDVSPVRVRLVARDAAERRRLQIQEYLGHADLSTMARYVKNLPVPRGTTERAKLEAYLAAEVGGIEK